MGNLERGVIETTEAFEARTMLKTGFHTSRLDGSISQHRWTKCTCDEWPNSGHWWVVGKQQALKRPECLGARVPLDSWPEQALAHHVYELHRPSSY